MKNDLVLLMVGALLTGCAAVPVAPVQSPFERCVATVASDKYSMEKMRAAQWCKDNDNGGIK